MTDYQLVKLGRRLERAGRCAPTLRRIAAKTLDADDAAALRTAAATLVDTVGSALAIVNRLGQTEE